MAAEQLESLLALPREQESEKRQVPIAHELVLWRGHSAGPACKHCRD